jgi:hypothetical protein
VIFERFSADFGRDDDEASALATPRRHLFEIEFHRRSSMRLGSFELVIAGRLFIRLLDLEA